jgi:hypothetical protein
MAGPGEKLKLRTAERLGAGGRRPGAAARFAVRAAGPFVRGIPDLGIPGLGIPGLGISGLGIPGLAFGRQTVDTL